MGIGHADIRRHGNRSRNGILGVGLGECTECNNALSATVHRRAESRGALCEAWCSSALCVGCDLTCKGTTQERAESVDDDGRGVSGAGERREDANRRVKSSSADAADGDGAGEYGESDGEAMVHAVLGWTHSGGVEDGMAEGKREHHLSDEA